MMVLICSIVIFVGFVLLQSNSYVSLVLGIIILGNGVILTIFLGANPQIGQFAFVSEANTAPKANDPLPQALVLTAIVIGFALTGFIVALAIKVSKTVGPIDDDALRVEEHVE